MSIETHLENGALGGDSFDLQVGNIVDQLGEEFEL